MDFGDIPNQDLKIIQRALKCLIGELDWSCKENLLEYELLDEVENELGHRFNAEQV